ncbi:MAG: TIGR00282 family metallophosphoesterase [bacterium]|nr:TIGR00282 family metallophosphoesterase [bacterium]
MKILIGGDVVGKVGRETLDYFLPQIKQSEKIDFVVANGENAAGGFGLTPKIVRQIFSYGVDCITGGNHIWSKKEIYQIIDTEERLLRPLNYPKGVPGRGAAIFELPNGSSLGVINLSGRVFLQELECPFRIGKEAITQMREHTHNIVVDIHSEATSEKIALGLYLDGQVSAVIGTHTHVQTADEKILPKGTAYITDIGMTGPLDSVIGVRKDIAIRRFLTQLPLRLETAKGPGQFCGAIVEIDESTGKAEAIKRVQLS